MDFHETVMGHRFFEMQLPKLIKALETQNELIKQQNELMQKVIEKMTETSNG